MFGYPFFIFLGYNLPPTRITNSSATSINLVCTNSSEEKVKVEIINRSLITLSSTVQLVSLWKRRKLHIK